jgi:hypothetical protein
MASSIVAAGCGGMFGNELRKCEEESSQLIANTFLQQEIGKMNVESLIKTVANPLAPGRGMAASNLGRLGIHTDDALHALADATNNKDKEVSTSARRALIQLPSAIRYSP